MTSPVSGWYPDPHGQPGERFWDGSAWTNDTRAVPPSAPTDAPPAYDGFGNPSAPPAYGQQAPANGQQPPSYGQPPPAYGSQPPAFGQQPPAFGQQPPSYGQQPPAYGQQPPAYGTPEYARQTQSQPQNFLKRNPLSLATIGVAIAYLLILVFAHVAILGILPLLLGIRAASRKEPLAVGAVVVGVAALIFGIYEYTRNR